MPTKTDSISFSNVKTIDTFQNVVKTSKETNVNKEQIEFISTCTNIENLTKYLEMVNNMLAKRENNGILSRFGEIVLSIFGAQSASKETLEALKTLITERINQLRFTA